MKQSTASHKLNRRSFLCLGATGIANLLLPRYLVLSPLESRTLPTVPPPSPLLPPSAFTILASDDEHNLLRSYVDIFEMFGFNTVAQADGREAYDASRRLPISLIVSDICKPYLNGLELLKLIRTDPITQHIPFIFVTAVDRSSARTEAFARGANAYLAKPFHPLALIYSVASLLPVEPISSWCRNKGN